MLLGEILRDPAFPAEDFEQMKLRSVTGVSRMETEPDALAGELLSRSLSQYPKGDVRYSATMKESARRLSGDAGSGQRDLFKAVVCSDR